MTEAILSGITVAIVVTDGFEQVELKEPRKALEKASAKTVLLAPHSGNVQGFNHDEKADSFTIDATLENADPARFDGMLIPGGALNADALRIIAKAQDFARAMDRDKKPIAVICHGPWLLVSAGLVKDRRLTSYPTIRDDIINAGGRWEDSEVVRDRNWVSSRRPGDIPAFNREMIVLFAEYRKSRRQDAA
jgi:protease I